MVRVSASWHLRMAVIMKASDVEHDSHEYHISVRWRLHPQTATSIKVISCLLLHIVSSRGSLPVAVGETDHEKNYSFLKLAFILAVIADKAHNYQTFSWSGFFWHRDKPRYETLCSTLNDINVYHIFEHIYVQMGTITRQVIIYLMFNRNCKNV